MPIAIGWKVWIYSLFAALIGGGASCIVNGITELITDPMHATEPGHLLKKMGVAFIVGSAIAVAGYLAKSPLPPPDSIGLSLKTAMAADGTQTISAKVTTEQKP